MIDSGSFLHAANAHDTFPMHEIKPQTACGGILEIEGTVDVDAEADGNKIGIKFNHMQVNAPILSVRRLVKDGYEKYIGNGGGFVEHLQTGKRLKLFEHKGVYYMKMKVNESDFQRQGA